jgi:hypothetical protein
VTVDGILDWQSDLLYTSTNYYNRLSQFFNQQLCKLHSRSIHLSLSLSAATWPSVYSLGPDPIGNTALALFSGQPFPSNAFFVSCLSSRYQVTSTPQAYMSHYYYYYYYYYYYLYWTTTKCLLRLGICYVPLMFLSCIVKSFQCSSIVSHTSFQSSVTKFLSECSFIATLYKAGFDWTVWINFSIHSVLCSMFSEIAHQNVM